MPASAGMQHHGSTSLPCAHRTQGGCPVKKTLLRIIFYVKTCHTVTGPADQQPHGRRLSPSFGSVLQGPHATQASSAPKGEEAKHQHGARWG